MTNWDANWGIVKGWLIAKDAPESVMLALDGLRDGRACLSRPVPIMTAQVRGFSAESVVTPTEVTPSVTEPSAETEPTTPPKKTRNWSPEQRVAAAERMRARMAKKRQLAKPETNPGE